MENNKCTLEPMNFPKMRIEPKNRAEEFTGIFTRFLSRIGGILLLLLVANQLSAQCNGLVCNNNMGNPIEVAVNQVCQIQITPAMIYQDTSQCPGPKTVTVYDTNGFVIPGSPVVNGNYLGQTLTARLTDVATGNFCETQIHVVDHLPPVFSNCDADITITKSCNASLNLVSIPPPSVSDNCDANLNVVSTDSIDGAGINCADTYSAVVYRLWIATDDFGNVDSCRQVIRMQRATVNDVTFSFNTGSPLVISCDIPVNLGDLNFFGQPFVAGRPLVTGGGFCELHAHYVDDTIPGCSPASFDILRHWTVLDLCTGQMITAGQVIQVRDLAAPVITCPGNITVGTNSFNCFANVNLPAASASDNCSGFTVLPSWNYGSGNVTGYGPFNGVPVGTYTVKYTATDMCNNSSSCTLTLTVVDDVNPVPICREFIVVSIPSSGTATVPASAFNNGSYDNCAITSITVRRMEAGSVFGPTVSFTCADIPTSPNGVIMRVRDAAGNSNTCMVQVSVQDGVAPAVVCPPSVTVSCTSDLTNLTPYGVPVVIDNCGATLDSTIVYNLNNCDVGTIVRTYTATDSKGNTGACQQVITSINDHPFTLSNITWPEDYNASVCTPSSALHPDSLPAPYNRPVYNSNNCALIATSYTDEYLNIAAPACYKILRKWKVIDWCQYDPISNPNAGHWEHIQILKVLDLVDPEIVCPASITVTTNNTCTGANVTLTAATATDCSPTITISNNYNNGGANASGFYPIGTRTVRFIASDACGNTASCTMKVVVKDLTPPSPICINGLSTDLGQMGNQIMAMVPAFALNNNSYDYCTDQSQLQLHVRKAIPNPSGPPTTTSVSYDCNDRGINYVELWVTDNAGNSDYCVTFIDVQDNMNLCPPLTQQVAAIAGAVSTEAGEHVENVTVQVNSTNAISPYLTGADGNFTFSGLTTGLNYTVMPEKNMNPLNGVTTYDLVLISKHILGTQVLDSPYKMIAADINKSGMITALDMVDLRKVILGVSDHFPNNTSWRFVKSGFVFPNPANPFQTDFPEVYDINSLPNGGMSADFVGIKVGDLNGNASANSLTGNESRGANGLLELHTDAAALEAGQRISVPFRAKDFRNVDGFQMTLQFDPQVMEYDSWKGGALSLDESNFGLISVQQGIITMSWNEAKGLDIGDEQVLFTLVFQVKDRGQLQEVMQLNSMLTPAEAYREREGSIGIEDLALAFDGDKGTSIVNNAYELYQNQPNPFHDGTRIGFHLPEAGFTSLKLFDSGGRLLKLVEGQYSEGYHEILIAGSDLPSTGVYYYQLETAKYTGTKKMIMY